jgi:uncharacterized protein (TIGR04141 family)
MALFDNRCGNPIISKIRLGDAGSSLMPTTKTFSLYLGKATITALDDLLTECAKEMVEGGRAKRISSDNFADESELFTFPGVPIKPKWVTHLEPVFQIEERLTSQSPCAVLIFRNGGRIYAVSFSYGHVYIDDDKTEADFGLKVAINAVSDNKLRSVERSNIGAAIREFAQAAGQRELKAFGFDEALELIRKVSGYATDDDFVDLVTGARALRFSKKMEIADIPDIATEALELFGKNTYQNTAFKIIDFLSPVLDVHIAKDLDEELVKAIREGSDEFEVAIPDILPTNVGTFRFERAGFSDYHPDLSLDLYREELGDDLEALTVSDIKKHRVAAYSEAGDTRIDSWSMRQALIGTLALNSERYALNEGVWYRIDQAYKDAADSLFSRLKGSPDPIFIPFRKTIGPRQRGRKPKTYYQSEESYNDERAAASGYLLLDRKLIGIPDEPGRGIEACDLLDVQGRRFIHVKKSSRQSSVLSHFFKQGANAAQMVRKYPPFRDALVAKVRELYGDGSADLLDRSLDEKWTVEFQIADTPRPNGDYNIPFFSKLTLRDETRSMEAMRFDVAVKFIRLAAAH